MSCGTIVLTYEQNIKGILQKMKNNENILIAKNADMFINSLKWFYKFKVAKKYQKMLEKFMKNITTLLKY